MALFIIFVPDLPREELPGSACSGRQTISMPVQSTRTEVARPTVARMVISVVVPAPLGSSRPSTPRTQFECEAAECSDLRTTDFSDVLNSEVQGVPALMLGNRGLMIGGSLRSVPPGCCTFQ